MSLVGLLLWALPFTKAAGFSFTVAKISVVALHLAGCLAFLRLLRICGVGPGLSLAAVATLIFHPLHFVHSWMFMTDVPAVAWQVIAVLCYVQAFDGEARPRRSALWLGLGALAAGLAFLIRQNGVLVPAALFLSALLWQRGAWRLRFLVPAFGPFLVIFLAFTGWYRWVHGPTSTFAVSMEQVLGFALQPPLEHLPYILFSHLMYLGLFLAPLALSSRWRSYPALAGVRGVLFLGVAWGLGNLFLHYALEGRPFPYIRNVVTPYGFFSSNEFLAGVREPLWGPPVGWLIGLAGLVSVLALAARLLGGRPPQTGAPAGALPFLLVLLVLQFLYLVGTSPILFDRHLLTLFPTALLVFCLLRRGARTLQPALCGAWLVLLACYSIAGTHDLHAVSRAAFLAGQDLLEEGIPAERISAGYAFDGWHMYEHSDPPDTRPVPPWWPPARDGAQPVFHSRQWWIDRLTPAIDAEYVVSASLPGENERSRRRESFELHRTYSFRTWWPWKRQTLYVLRKPAR